jgi:hypothetical protein
VVTGVAYPSSVSVRGVHFQALIFVLLRLPFKCWRMGRAFSGTNSLCILSKFSFYAYPSSVGVGVRGGHFQAQILKS